MWIDGVAAKGYLKDELAELFGRYITQEDLEELAEEPGGPVAKGGSTFG